MDTIKENGTGSSVHGHKINNLQFADKIDLLEEHRDELQENLKRPNEAGEASGLKINKQETMTMVFGQENIVDELMIDSIRIKNINRVCVPWYPLLTGITTAVIKSRGGLHEQLERWLDSKKVWNSMHISIQIKFSIIRSCVMSVLLCETWTLRRRDIYYLMAFEMKCYRRILHIHWQQKIMNVEIRQRLDNKKNAIQMIMKRKFKLFGHICRIYDNLLVKNVVFGIIDGLNRGGRPMDDIKEWCRTYSESRRRTVRIGDELSLRQWIPTEANHGMKKNDMRTKKEKQDIYHA